MPYLEREIEDEARRRGITRYAERRDAAEKDDAPERLRLVRDLILGQWLDAYRQAIEEEKTKCERSKTGRPYGPTLCAVPTEVLAGTGLYETIALCQKSPHGVTVAALSDRLARTICDEVRGDLNNEKDRKACTQAAWRTVELLIDVAQINVGTQTSPALVPAFVHEVKWVGKNDSRGIVNFSARARDSLAVRHLELALFTPPYPPMVKRPSPWRDEERTGGYLVLRTHRFTVRTRPSPPQVNEYVREAINVLDATPWRINRRIFEEVCRAWEEQVDIRKMPKKTPLDELRKKCDALKWTPHARAKAKAALKRHKWIGEDKARWRNAWRQVNEASPRPTADDQEAWKKREKDAKGLFVRFDTEHEKADTNKWRYNMASGAYYKYKWLQNRIARQESFELMLDVARRLVEHENECIYFPHALDFRGRIYAIPNYLNLEGDDACRGMLELADPRPLTERGRWWIKVHLASCCRLPKEPYYQPSFEQRVAWVDENRDMIDGWARVPRTNTGWRSQKRPWQALAAAIALNDNQAGAHLAVRVDGTCNAWQHYAALLKSRSVAAWVNLLPEKRAFDFYDLVCVLINAVNIGMYSQIVDRDGQILCRTRPLSPAPMLSSRWLNRDVLKHPIMTLAYGLTPKGAEKQIREAILDREDLEPAEAADAGKQVAELFLHTFENLAPAILRTRDWFMQCAEAITRLGEPVRWTTPLGMVVEQPYRKQNSLKIRTGGQLQKTITLNHWTKDAPLIAKKHATAFAANYVHSLDSSHLMRVATACGDRIHLGTVHDAFLTHAEDMDELGRILRREFLALHKRPLLDELFEELKTRYPGASFQAPPFCGDLDLTMVEQSPYCFS